MPHKRNYNYIHWHQDHMPHKSKRGYSSLKVSLLFKVVFTNNVRIS